MLISTDQADRQALASARLVEANGIDLTHLERTLRAAMRPSDDQADVYLQYKSGETWALENGVVKRVSMSIDEGFGLRAVSGDQTAFAYSESIDSDSLSKAAQSVASMEVGAAVIPASGGPRTRSTASSRIDAELSALYLPDDPLGSLAPAAKVALLHRLDAMSRRVDASVVRVFANLSSSHEYMLVMNDEQRLAGDVRPQSSLNLRVVVERNGRTESASSGIGGRYGYDRFDEAALASLAQRVVASAVAKLDADAAPSGELTVVLSPGWAGILLHEAVGHGLEADFIQRGNSVFTGKVGQQVTAPGITIVDDGTLREHRGSLSVDDEGNPSEDTVLIENGVLRGFMQDSKSARLTGAAPTGNGRRESFARLPMPRMTNTYMRKGEHDPGEVIESVKNGLYVRDLSDGQVDIVSGNFVFNAALAYLIEGGKITRPVKGATLTGNGLQTLRKVSMIGNDLALDPGIAVCGKAGQSVPVCVGQPTLRIDGITVGGTR